MFYISHSLKMYQELNINLFITIITKIWIFFINFEMKCEELVIIFNNGIIEANNIML